MANDRVEELMRRAQNDEDISGEPGVGEWQVDNEPVAPEPTDGPVMVGKSVRLTFELVERLRKTADANEIIVNWPLEANLLREAADEILRWRRAVYMYRWEKLAKGLVVCHRMKVRLRDDTTGRIRDRVIHVAGCRHIPNPANDRIDSTDWFVFPATGHSLWDAVNNNARICKICKPHVDVEAVIDG